MSNLQECKTKSQKCKIASAFANFSELVMLGHTIFSASFILIAMCVASIEVNASVWAGWRVFFLCVIALISARNFAMGFNRLCDKDIDSRNDRTKRRPSVDGRISVRAMIIFCVVNAAIFIITGYFINTLAFALSVPFLVILGGYSLMKRVSSLAHIVLGISLGLAPIAGVIAIEGAITLWCVLLALGVVFWVAGFDILYSLQDLQVDKREGLFSVPSRFGVIGALRISRVFHVLAVGFWCAFAYVADIGAAGWVGIALSAGMLIYEQYLVHRDFANIPRAFFTTNGYLGFVLLACIVIDGLMRTI
ncbi:MULTISPECIES: menaquinone biosynthesis prenyltransferase MqnP [unclassified Helicobacter]|uniref:menaquinone biosynthesis prenyltransferase MqnP n=1 Tax=unclassified Helicobacter TaxID=2593540 RepID=UPI0009EDF54B|nr:MULTISPECIES: menaquinone biosynthesis prenyltransferase MqnP [unclassified Helicobacter]